MKRTLSGLLAAVFCFLLCAPVSAVNTDYEFPNDWSREALIFAVDNGIYCGDPSGDLLPKEDITRAEMASALVRLLGAEETADLSAYLDVYDGAWYLSALSAAVRAGIFSGITATSMAPNRPITREQAAAVLCRAFGIVSDDRSAYTAFTDAKLVSAYARDAVSALYSRGILRGYPDGSFRPADCITRAEVAQLFYALFDCVADTPDEIPVSGVVLYRGSEPLPDDFMLDGTLVLGAKAPASFSAGAWKLTGTLVVRTGEHTNADLRGLTAAELVCATTGGTVTANAKTVRLWGTGLSYCGDAERLISVGGSQSVTGDCASVEVRGGTLTLSGSAENITLGTAVLTLNGTADTVSIDGRDAVLNGSGHAASVIVNEKNADVTVGYDSLTDNWAILYQKEHDSALETVRTQRVPCTMHWDTALYQNRNLTGYIRTLPRGTVVYNQWHPDTAMRVTCEDGTWGWISSSACNITDDATTDGDLDYSQATKEGFVDLKGYSSDTPYLVWVSRYTQKVMVFEGEKGNWELIRTFDCSTGANITPTPVGVFDINSFTWEWDFADYYVTRVSIFNGGHAFHTIPYYYGGGVYDGRVGIPLSHGCVRMYPDDCSYIYNLPLHTRVVVY